MLNLSRGHSMFTVRTVENKNNRIFCNHCTRKTRGTQYCSDESLIVLFSPRLYNIYIYIYLVFSYVTNIKLWTTCRRLKRAECRGPRVARFAGRRSTDIVRCKILLFRFESICRNRGNMAKTARNRKKTRSKKQLT